MAQLLTTPRGFKDPAAAAVMLEQAAVEVEKRYGSLDPAWGDYRRLRRGSVDLPANGASGGLGAFRVLAFGPPENPKPAAVFGDTFVACVEFSNPPHAQVLVSYGNSSQPGTTHSDDQLPLSLLPRMRSR